MNLRTNLTTRCSSLAFDINFHSVVTTCHGWVDGGSPSKVNNFTRIKSCLRENNPAWRCPHWITTHLNIHIALSCEDRAPFHAIDFGSDCHQISSIYRHHKWAQCYKLVRNNWTWLRLRRLVLVVPFPSFKNHERRFVPHTIFCLIQMEWFWCNFVFIIFAMSLVSAFVLCNPYRDFSL